MNKIIKNILSLVLFCIVTLLISFSFNCGGGDSDSGKGTLVIQTNRSDASFSVDGPGGHVDTASHPLGLDNTMSISNLKPGNYTVTFNQINDCLTTPNQDSGYLEKDQVLTLKGDYSGCGPGTIKVYTNNGNASFTISGEETFNGNSLDWETVVAPEGSYTITFNAIENYTTPFSMTKTLTGGQVIIFTGNYTEEDSASDTGEIDLVSNHPQAVFFVNGPVYLVGSGQDVELDNVPEGEYTITYADIPGFTPPDSQTITVSKDRTADISSNYIEKGGSTPTNNGGSDTSAYFFYDDFENGLDSSKWDAGAEWNLTSESSRRGTYSFTDSPAGDYPNNANTTAMTAGLIDLSTADAPVLKFWYQCSLFNNAYGAEDYIYVDISDDGGFTWTNLWSLYDTTINSWTPVILDLSGYKTDKVKIMFRLRTDNGNQADGWYIDDVEIKENQ